jgi:hypothetical protein
MKFSAIAFFASLILCLHVNAATLGLPRYSDTLTTPNFVITIALHCDEGVVECDQVTYRGQAKRTGSEILLNGKTMHTKCADGVTPCRFLGYPFKNGDTNYFVYDNGRLRVVGALGKVVVDEQGEWGR